MARPSARWGLTEGQVWTLAIAFVLGAVLLASSLRAL